MAIRTLAPTWGLQTPCVPLKAHAVLRSRVPLMAVHNAIELRVRKVSLDSCGPVRIVFWIVL